MVEVSKMYKNIKPIAKYKKCGRTVTVFMDKDGKKKTIERVDDKRWSVQDYSWLSEMMPCPGTGYAYASCGRTCKKRRKLEKKKTKKAARK
jgi:DNA gyrase/topoisomerase IV subunit B